MVATSLRSRRAPLRRATLALALLAAAAGCQRAKKGEEKKPPTAGQTDTDTGKDKGAAAPDAPVIDLDSKDILARTEVADAADVKHVLIGWKGMGRSQTERTNAEAAKLAKD